MGNLNCYEEKESEKAQIKTNNPSELINIDAQNFFIEYSLNSIPLEYSQTNKEPDLLLSSFDQINNTIKTFQIEGKSKNNSKFLKNRSFPNLLTNKLINRSFSVNKKNRFLIQNNSKIIEHNKSQIIKVVTINNFFLQNNKKSIDHMKNNSKYKIDKFLNISNPKLTKERIKNISATKIQRKYRSIKNKLNYQKNIRPKLIQE